MIDDEIDKEAKKCKDCKQSLKKKGHWCDYHIALNDMDMFICFGTEQKKPIKSIEYYTKAVAMGIRYLVRRTKQREK